MSVAPDQQAYEKFRQEFSTLANHTDWTPAGGVCPFLFGQQCVPLRACEAAHRAVALDTNICAQYLENCAALLTRPLRDAISGASAKRAAPALRNAIVNACSAALSYYADRDDKQAPQFFGAAASDFDTAYGKHATHQDANLKRGKDQYFRHFCGASPKPLSAGCWVAWDVVDRILMPRNGRDNIEERRVDTPVVLDDGFGTVALLTIELIYDGGECFLPDPYWMGCLSFDENLLASMQAAWSVSGLQGQGVRGRWRLTAYEPTDFEHEGGLPQHGLDNVQRKPLALEEVTGPSLQAAALVALWAAAGGVPGDKFHADGAMPLDPCVAVSAQVDSTLEPKTAAERMALKLRPVGGVPAKIRAAHHAKLIALLLSKDEKKSDDETDTINAVKTELEQQKAAGKIKEAEVLERDPTRLVSRASTIGEAFDSLLVTNRHLADLQKDGRERWLCQWEGETGKFKGSDKVPGDNAGWDDAMAEKARERIAQERDQR